MKHIIILITSIFLTLISGQALAQSTTTIQPLNVGDPIPDEVWNLPLQVVNHPEGKETFTLADYKDKLIIIDFWATWCVPCINSLYKLDTLQGQFTDDLVVIPTTYEGAEKAGNFFEERGWQLPTAVLETTLKSYFPHRSIPHQVWVKDGNVLSIVGSEYANANYISKVLQGQEVDFTHKIEVAFDKTKPLFLDGNGGDGSNMLYQSVLSGRLKARVSGTSRPSPNHILAYNRTIQELYSTALGGKISPLYNANYIKKYIIYEIDDSLKFKIDATEIISMKDHFKTEQWANENLYCYNLVLPEYNNYEHLYSKMFVELNDFFSDHAGFYVKYETRNVEALALVSTDENPKILTKGSESFRKAHPEIKDKMILQNQPMSVLIHFLNNSLASTPKPIVDETGIDFNVDIEIDFIDSDIQSVKKELSKYGLDLVEKMSTVKMIVFKYADQQDTDGVED